ncbi:MAG: hypothetical protein P9M12_03980 [Candidatus Aceula lacicola]|nr:hypothetical protein [Candidatus Aceula lacicola]
MRKITILAIGDSADFDSFKKFDKEKRFISSKGFDYVAIDYKAIFKKCHLDVTSKKVIVVTFFPFEYWDKHVECKKYKGLYGNLLFLKKFSRFCDDVSSRVKDLLPGKEIEFVNNPKLTSAYRDKVVAMGKLSKAGVKVPPRINAKSVKGIKSLLSCGKKIYVKPRCGSMGKGITYLTEDRWQTNFTVKSGKIVQRCSDYGWKFKDITGDTKFLKSLVRGDFIMEEAVSPCNIGDNKIDLRVYACFGKVLYIYPRKNSIHAVTTNISQGGKGSPAILKKLPKATLDKVERQVRKTMRALNLNFAGIDVILDKDLKNAYVIDVNMFPGFPKRRTHNLARDIICQLRKSF